MEAIVMAQPVKQQRRGAGRPFPKGVSGNPKGDPAKTIRERAAELRATILSDFQALAAIDSVLLDRACLLLAKSERLHRTKDVDAGIRMTSEARRILQSLRRHRRSRDVAPLSLREQLQAEADAAAGEAVDVLCRPMLLRVLATFLRSL